ncbi:thiamine-phosphate kinase [Bacillus sp. FJAT-45066]|uniref:thiamine-phosphate kinase n=1 Tax=Bacillus sp. FJAT-45066 TaxID=2011010 RepID=UPI000BB772C0|nr:thiamine-phosphate kinase [Bacillus sp. FJAT-45066]
MSISDEFQFIKKIQPNNLFHKEQIVGIGDDAAILTVENSYDQVICVDTMVEDVHFAHSTMDSYSIGYKALASNISDIAAMGGIPLYYLVSITIPPHWDENSLIEIYKGMEKLAVDFQMDLIGGDTTSSSSKLVLSVTVIGKVEKGKRLLRSNAKQGDVVFVSGTLGDSAAGLDLLLKSVKDQEPYTHLIRAHQQPSPRVELGRILSSYERVSLNDISDGLASELLEITEASHVNIYIEEKSLPISQHVLDYNKSNALKWALTGGEDFELVGTISSEDWVKLLHICKEKNIDICKIGQVVDGTGKVFLKRDGKVEELEKSGFNHFQNR